MTPKTWLFVPDCHFPHIHKPTFRVLMDFVGQNKIAGFVFGGDQFDNACISHHTRGKALLRDRAAFKREEKQFSEQVLKPIEASLDRGAQKIWIQGNHDFWEQELVEHHPEFDGLQRQHSLDLAGRGWKFVGCGKSFKHGKLTFIHGDTLSGKFASPAAMFTRRALDMYSGSILFGHFHGLQVASKVMPFDHPQKWTATCSPILGQVNAQYLRNRPQNFLNGFSAIEFHPDGCFNLFPIVATSGRAIYGGAVYGKK